MKFLPFFLPILFVLFFSTNVQSADFPDLKVGAVYGITDTSISPSVSLELFETENGKVSFDIGVAKDILYLDAVYNIVPVIEIGIGPLVGYDVETKEYTIGVTFSWIKF